MTKPIGLTRLSAPAPASARTRRISSVAYATEDKGSDESTARPVKRESRSWWARWDGIGSPTSSRLSCETKPSVDTCPSNGRRG